jgi:hypothetical protein
MTFFSPKSRRLIEAAFADLGGTSQRDVWQAWVRANPDIRGPAGAAWQSLARIMPFEVAMATLFALEHLTDEKRKLRDARGLSDDEISDLDNDLSYVKSVERFVAQAAALRAA